MGDPVKYKNSDGTGTPVNSPSASADSTTGITLTIPLKARLMSISSIQPMLVFEPAGGTGSFLVPANWPTDFNVEGWTGKTVVIKALSTAAVVYFKFESE